MVVLEIGRRVTICDLQTRPELNGSPGVVKSHDAESESYAIELTADVSSAPKTEAKAVEAPKAKAKAVEAPKTEVKAEIIKTD